MNIVLPKVDMTIQTTAEFYETHEKYFEQMSLDFGINIDIVDKETGKRIMLLGGRI